MKCVACGKDHWEGDECPRCHFPVYEILGDDLDQSVAQIQAFAKEFQKEYLNDLQLGVVTYQWKDQNGLVKEASHAPVYFAAGSILASGEFWYPQKLARIPDQEYLPVTLAFKKGSTEWQVPTQVPNLKQAELQQVGFRLEDELQVRLLLKNDSAQTESEPVSVCQ